jgi:hypothetical protein
LEKINFKNFNISENNIISVEAANIAYYGNEKEKVHYQKRSPKANPPPYPRKVIKRIHNNLS